MVSKFFKAYIELVFIFYAYAVGYLYLAPIYLMGFVVPPFKKTILEFETSGSYISIATISIISGSIIFFLAFYVPPHFKMSSIEIPFWYIGYFGWGYFALYLLDDYRKKKHFFK